MALTEAAGRISLRGALALVAVCVAALILCGLTVTALGERADRAEAARETQVRAAILAQSVTAALDFEDPLIASEYVDALDRDPAMAGAAVYRADGDLFAGRRLDWSPPEAPVSAVRVDDGFILATEPIAQGDRLLGYAVVRARMEPLGQRLGRYAGVALLALMGALFLLCGGVAFSALKRVQSELERHAGELAESQRQLATLLDNLPGFAYRAGAGPERAFVYVSEGVRELSGRSQAEFAGGAVSWGGLTHAEDRDRVWRSIEECVGRRKPFESAYRIQGPGGEERWVWERGQGVFAQDGRLEAIEGFVTDVTEQRRTEEALRQSQKLETIGQLTGGVAHDFNNLLTPIMGGLDLLRRHVKEDAKALRWIDAALHSAEMARSLVQRLLSFARRQALVARTVDVPELIGGLQDLIARSLGPGIVVQVEIEPNTPCARVDPNQLELSILNLAVNARDAMPDGGILIIKVGAEEVGAGHAAALKPGRYVRIAVIDTGVGMDAATLARAVEPFFSTKGVGKGTGLGLPAAHGLAVQSGGALKLTSAPGEGACVQMWLPVSNDAPPPRALRKFAEPERPSEPALVLLVEDQASVRRSVAEMLWSLGYAVTEASSGEEALVRIRESAPDLVVTDHLMPGLTGAELAQQVKAAHPDVPVLIITGYAERAVAEAEAPCLAKPFRREDLARALGSLLRDRARTMPAPMPNRA